MAVDKTGSITFTDMVGSRVMRLVQEVAPTPTAESGPSFGSSSR
ncbi:MAG: hypothetical protein WAW17_04675 [Rhodococcus sp. (in: high G+C Gram-positive bacteria)]